MDDMNAFERQVAGEFVRRAGPVRPVNAAAIFTAITTTQSPKWRFQSMFSATKFVAAGAIVALFGGFLLSGVLTQQEGEVLPAGVTESSSPMTTVEPLSGMVTDEVEPGVYRVVSDGIRDLAAASALARPDDGELAIAPDGSVWLSTIRRQAPPRDPELIKLGDPDSFPMPSSWWGLNVGPDGTPWAWVDTGLLRLGEDGWSEVAGTPEGGLFDIAPDGTVWAGGGDSVSRLEAEGWQEHRIDIDPDIGQLLEDHGGPDAVGLGHSIQHLGVDANGDVWVGLTLDAGGEPPMVLLRYDGETWSLVDPLGVGTYHNMVLPRTGADGTMWVYLETGTATVDTFRDPDHRYLARLSDGNWTVFSDEDGVVPLGSRGSAVGLLRVDHSGRAWVRDGPSGGVRVFDGQTWRHYLEGDRVIDMEVAPDGNVWVLAPEGLYVITP